MRIGVISFSFIKCNNSILKLDCSKDSKRIIFFRNFSRCSLMCDPYKITQINLHSCSAILSGKMTSFLTTSISKTIL